MKGYDYITRVVAPSVVEFYCTQPQGHRVIRIYLDSLNPRFTMFNENGSTRSPATLYLKELHDLIDKARVIVSIPNNDKGKSS